jgi:hypothetical protein
MTRLAFVLLAACGSAAELGAPNPPPEWPMGTNLHNPTPVPAAPEPPPAGVEGVDGVTAGPDGSAVPPTEVTEPPAPATDAGPDGAEVPVAPEPPEEQ